MLQNDVHNGEIWINPKCNMGALPSGRSDYATSKFGRNSSTISGGIAELASV